MKIELQDSKYSHCLSTTDWRFSATIVGLLKYFKFCVRQFSLQEEELYSYKNDDFYYNNSEITTERFLQFIEHFYEENLHHIFVQNNIVNPEKIDEINKRLQANSVMKKVFKGVKFDGQNSSEILELINKSRDEIIIETFKNGLSMYANYCNVSKLFADEGKSNCCRVVGYYIDMNRKGKSASYLFDMNNFNFVDIDEFDFIPFGFSGARESFFINCSASVSELFINNIALETMVKDIGGDGKKVLFKSIVDNVDFLKYDVEIITKSQDDNYFETLYLTQKAIKVLKNNFFTSYIGKAKKPTLDYLFFAIKITDKYYIKVHENVFNSIVNNIALDDTIDFLLKQENFYTYQIYLLIRINLLIKERGQVMVDLVQGAKNDAKKVVNKLDSSGRSNQIKGYRSKLTSAIVAKDYDRVCAILLQLSNATDLEFSFAYKLYKDFDGNKDAVYSFINALILEKGDK